jgi:predicted DNA-binding protein
MAAFVRISETPCIGEQVVWIPLSLDERYRELARERGVGATTLIRQILEAGVAELDSTAAASLADVQRAIASLARPACAPGPEPGNH